MNSIESKLKEVFKRTKSITIKTQNDLCIIENNRKSRFIMKDAKNLIKKIEDAEIMTDSQIIFYSLTPVCGKSIKYLRGYGLTVRG